MEDLLAIQGQFKHVCVFKHRKAEVYSYIITFITV